MECRNCKQEVIGNYCAHCGLKVEPTRIDGKYIVDEIASVLSFKKGFLFTIKELLLKPGKNIRSFIVEDRNRLVKPVIFLIFSSFIYTVLQQVLQFEDGYINSSGEALETTGSAITAWIQGNYGYANIFIALFVSMWAKLLFRKYIYNFFEVLILMLFVFGMSMLIYSVFGIFESATQLKVMQIGGITGFIYASWAIGQFFDAKKIQNYFKGFLSYVLGFITFIFSTIGLGLLVDFLIRSIG